MLNLFRAYSSVAILGAGNGGFSMSADLSLRGHDVSLFEMPQFSENIETLLETQEIRLFGETKNPGLAKLDLVTTDISQAIEGREFVFVSIPSLYHGDYARLLSSTIQEDQVIILTPGTGGSLEMKKIFTELGNNDDMTIVEYDTLPFATRIMSEDSVKIFHECSSLGAGVFPSDQTADVMSRISHLYHVDPIYDHVLHGALCSLNPVLHIGALVLNIGRIERFNLPPFYFYEDGYTPSTAKIVEKVDFERIRIGESLGFSLPPVNEVLYEEGFGPKGTILECVKGSYGLCSIEGPLSINTRYLLEDVPIGLVLWSNLAKVLGVETPIMDSMIHIVSGIFEQDFFETGRNLKTLGVDGMSLDDILSYLKTGIQ